MISYIELKILLCNHIAPDIYLLKSKKIITFIFRHKRKKVFKKHVRPHFRPHEDNSFRPAPFGIGGRPKRRPHHHHHHGPPHPPHRQPHKYRKKYPYYGRKKRSPE